jgi:hypothetical protein
LRRERASPVSAESSIGLVVLLEAPFHIAPGVLQLLLGLFQHSVDLLVFVFRPFTCLMLDATSFILPFT